MGEQVRAAIAEAIAAHGPIGFDEYMELALYGPGGFYERPPIGAEGEFVTSPHVHPVFAQLLGAALKELWDLLGRPEPLRITEAGAGDGTLARQLLGALADVPVEYTAVERSPGARAALERKGIRVERELGGDPHVVLAHELLDNLPFRRFHGGREVRIGLEGDRLVEVGEGAGDETIEPVGALAFVDRLAAVIARGYALLIDYGEVGGTGGPSHGYRAHRVIEDLLVDPGSTDITAGVDFQRIARRAQERGLVALGSVSQRDALLQLGFEEWILAESGRQRRLLDERQGLEAVRAWGGRSRATLLADPTALGRLRWLLLATTGLGAPGWLAPSD